MVIFSSYWAESTKGCFFIIDPYPTADLICDIPYLEKDEAQGPEYMKALNAGKEAIRTHFRERYPGSFMMEKAVGKKMADLGLRAIF